MEATSTDVVQGNKFVGIHVGGVGRDGAFGVSTGIL
jgi:hypothetical protein